MSPHVWSNLIDYYRGEGNLVEHIQRHQVSTGDETIHAFMGPNGSSLCDNMSGIHVNIVEEIAVRVKSYIDFEIAKERRKKHKKTKKRSM